MSNARTPIQPCLLIPILCYKSRKNALESINTLEMIQTPNTTGIEPVSGVMYCWGYMTQLMNPHSKTTKGTQTHQDLRPDQIVSGTSEALGSASSSWAAQTRPRRRVRNRTFILCLLGPSSVEADGVPEVGKDGNWCHL